MFYTAMYWHPGTALLEHSSHSSPRINNCRMRRTAIAAEGSEAAAGCPGKADSGGPQRGADPEAAAAEGAPERANAHGACRAHPAPPDGQGVPFGCHFVLRLICSLYFTTVCAPGAMYASEGRGSQIGRVTQRISNSRRCLNMRLFSATQQALLGRVSHIQRWGRAITACCSSAGGFGAARAGS